MSRKLVLSSSAVAGSREHASSSGGSLDNGNENKSSARRAVTHAKSERPAESDSERADSAGKKHRSEEKAPAAASLPKSRLTFEDVRNLTHVVVAHRVSEEPEVDLWHADVVSVNEAKRTIDVRIREWRRVVTGVEPSAVFRPSTTLPAV